MRNNADDASTPTAARAFHKGLALRSRTELIYRLPAGIDRFTALAGIDPATRRRRQRAAFDFRRRSPAARNQIAGDQPPQPIDLKITGARRLKILVDFGQNLDSGDWLNLCDAKIVK